MFSTSKILVLVSEEEFVLWIFLRTSRINSSSLWMISRSMRSFACTKKRVAKLLVTRQLPRMQYDILVFFNVRCVKTGKDIKQSNRHDSFLFLARSSFFKDFPIEKFGGLFNRESSLFKKYYKIVNQLIE